MQKKYERLLESEKEMKEFVEKLSGRLEEKRMEYFLTMANTGDEKLDFVYENIGDLIDSITVIVNILAEEYNQDSTKKNQEWIPVTERLPEKHGHYLVCSKDVIWVAVYYNYTWWGVEKRCRWGDVEAWQPLPEPYKEEQ